VRYFLNQNFIGKIAEGISIERLCSGVNYSLYKRLQNLLNKFRGKKLVLTGGVANNIAIREYLKKDYEEIVSVEEPQFNGAIGCCYYGSKILR
jgi:Activator of 2-hydroxyglutaryl-CoA dehydratase (HSP70-class ATPase domain)